MAIFLQNQTMDIYDQPNVKGWKGGQHWLTAQTFQERSQMIDFLLSGNKKYENQFNNRLKRLDGGYIDFKPNLTIKNRLSAATILEELTQNMVFEVSEEMKEELNQILKYDFDPQAENAEKSIQRVYAYLAKSPEFQII